MGLKLTAKLLDYAIDFEVAYKTDEWANVEGYFTSDARYIVRNTSFACSLSGASNIVQGFKRSLDGFDRHLDRSLSVIEGPFEIEDRVTFVWVGTYSASGVPSLQLSARQTLHFRDGLIELLMDEFLPDDGEKAGEWIIEVQARSESAV